MITGTEMVFQGKPCREVWEFCVPVKQERTKTGPGKFGCFVDSVRQRDIIRLNLVASSAYAF